METTIGFRVLGLGFVWVWDLGFRVYGIYGLGFEVLGFGV